MTNIELTDQEVEQFKAFREHQDRFNLLLEAGFFNIKGASGTVHFDDKGNIRKVDMLMVRLYHLQKL